MITLLVVGMAPFAFTHDMRVKGDRFQVWPALASMVFAFFFCAMLETFKSTYNSFDGGIDSYNPEAFLVETDHMMFTAFTECHHTPWAMETTTRRLAGKWRSKAKAAGLKATATNNEGDKEETKSVAAEADATAAVEEKAGGEGKA